MSTRFQSRPSRNGRDRKVNKITNRSSANQYKKNLARGSGPLRNKAVDRVTVKKTILDYTKDQNRLVILNEPGRFMPDRIFANLRLVDHQQSRGSTAARVSNWFYQSSALTPDTSAGGNYMPGYLELSQFYARTRVHSIVMHLEMYNQTTQAIQVVCFPSVVNFATNTLTADDIMDYSINPLAHTQLMGGSGSNGRVSINILASGLRLIGPSFATDVDYTAGSATNPAAMFYANVAISNTIAANMSALCPIRIVMEYEVEFYDQYPLDT